MSIQSVSAKVKEKQVYLYRPKVLKQLLKSSTYTTDYKQHHGVAELIIMFFFCIVIVQGRIWKIFK
jgi:hypothetical protein